jgi:hypothetical protein
MNENNNIDNLINKLYNKIKGSPAKRKKEM